jgi:hypothetical protein
VKQILTEPDPYQYYSGKGIVKPGGGPARMTSQALGQELGGPGSQMGWKRGGRTRYQGGGDVVPYSPHRFGPIAEGPPPAKIGLNPLGPVGKFPGIQTNKEPGMGPSYGVADPNNPPSAANERKVGGRARRAGGGGIPPGSPAIQQMLKSLTPTQMDAVMRAGRSTEIPAEYMGKGSGDYPENWNEEVGFGAPGSKKSGGRLSAADRRSLPSSDFALPGKGEGPEGKGSGSYPINDESHARNALSRVSQHGTSAEKAQVRAAVHRKYPGIGQS